MATTGFGRLALQVTRVLRHTGLIDNLTCCFAFAQIQGVTSTLSGSGSAAYADGTGVSASFNRPFGVFGDSFGNLIVSDRDNHRVRKVTSSGECAMSVWDE